MAIGPPDRKMAPVIDHIPDLLNATARAPENRTDLRDKLTFAFTTGDSAGALRQALDDAPVDQSDWDPDCFQQDLFISELIETCFQIELDLDASQSLSFLKRVLCHPPTHLKAVLYRQQIQRELLAQKKLRREFESVYRELIVLRTVLDSAGMMGRVYSTRRRIDILNQIKKAIDKMAAGFETAESGIRRIREYALEFQHSDGFERLAEFLDYESNLANVQLHLRVGSDGSVRRFQVVQIAENKTNRYYAGPLHRLITRFRLFWRGYGATKDELVERWVDGVFEGLVDSLSYFLQLLGDMECHLAGLAFCDQCRTRKLPTCFPEFMGENKSSGRRAKQLFNPLLFIQDEIPVPCDLQTERDDAMMIITGPNSGGKTRLLQAIGLLQLLAQAGFAVPAKFARLRFASGLFVSLMEGAKADQAEGRLGMELLRIRQLFERLRPGGLVVLDELCSGTNPSEGEEIFLLVLTLLREMGPEAFISTHFLRFAKELASNHTALNLEFIQVALDRQQVPTYGFISGVAETSLAKHTAQRLGVTKTDLLDLIERHRK